ncbi:MAG TPA: TlpA disulfide reductase family protein [Ferruginibacter sp.]|nr:TlpA disulfide reductase family protein [Ferruginibacter sp.]
MNKIIQVGLLFLISLNFFEDALGQHNKCVVNVSISNKNFSDMVYLIEGEKPFDDLENQIIIDSAYTNSGRIHFSINLAYADYYSVKLKSFKKAFTFVGVPQEEIFIEADTSNFFYPKINNSLQNKYRQEYIRNADALVFLMNSYVDSVSSNNNNTEAQKKYTSLYYEQQQKIREYNLLFLRTNSKSLTALKLLKIYNKNISYDTVRMFIDSLPSELRKNPLAEKIIYEKFTLEKDLGNIKHFYDLKLKDTNRVIYNLHQLEGKYVLIDFWASWCAPCMKNIPDLISIYNKFNSKRFTIIGVSLDDKLSKWKASIKKHNLKWVNISDLKGWDGLLVKYLKINAIPRYILLDPDGKIIVEDINIKDVEKKVIELFNN